MPLFARPNGNEAWVLLLEKAFAKMLGSYQALVGGNCCTAFRAFTGESETFVWARGDGEKARVEGAWKRMDLALGEDHFTWQPGDEQRRDSEGLWSEVQNYDKRSFLVACSIRDRHGAEHVRRDGLVEAHAYSLLQVVSVEGQQLLFLRNPWGNDRKWNGRWSDGDIMWTKMAAVRRRLRPEFQNDGAFWIAWSDFQDIFDFVYVCGRSMRTAKAAREHAKMSSEGRWVAAKPRVTRRVEALPEALPVLPPGTRVEMRMPEHLEGRIAEVVSWDEARGYELKEVPTPYWYCPECGEINRRARETCNVCGAQRSAVLPIASFRAQASSVVLPPGSVVELKGLEYFPELNGQAGTIVSFDRHVSRYHVRLSDGHVRAIRPPHLIARRAPAEESDFSQWVPPPPETSFVDEPEPPESVPCVSHDDARRLVDALDDDFCLRRDVEAAGRKLCGGLRLVREGQLRRSLAELRRPNAFKLPVQFNFLNPCISRGASIGSYLDLILQLDRAVSEMLRVEAATTRLSGNMVAFFHIASPGWSGPVEAAPRSSAWCCQHCGHVNEPGSWHCAGCSSDEGDG